MAVKNSLVKTQAQKNPLEIVFKAGEEDVKLSPATVKNYLVSGDAGAVTNQEIVMFMNLCKFQHLNPFLREAYLIKFGSQPATLVVGKTAFEKRAARCENYKGFSAGIVVTDSTGALEEREGTLVLPDETIVGGWAEVFVSGYEKPVKAVVGFNEYAGRKKDGSLNGQWSSKPATMIRKVAKVQALREAFPEDFAGMYAAEESGVTEPLPEIPVEIPQNDNAVDVYAERIEEPVQASFADIMEG